MVPAMQIDLSRTVEVLNWNRRIFSVLGIWPPNIDDRIFSFFFVYLTIHCCLEYAELIEYIDDLEYVVANLTENTILTMILFKIGAYRFNAKQLREVLEDIEDDFTNTKYKTTEERLAFFEYNATSKRFIKIAIPLIFAAAFMFYLRPLTGQLSASKSHAENTSAVYVIPYRTRLFFEVTELRTYVLVYVCQVPIVPLVTFGYTGTDCLLVTLMLHVCGQLSALSHRVKEVTTSPLGYRHVIRELVTNHLRLIRLVNILDSAFNLLLLQQLVGITIILCLVGYNVIANSEDGQKAHLFTHLLYASSMLLLLFGYCLIGECLINESVNIGNAFYDCNWYEVPPKHLKLFLVCMARSQSPLVLTAGRFYIFSLQSFTDVMKTSMAYLSMLRTFL
uniref:Odorant receptor n=1 Tax=Sirex noctilio TaxID=36765 RepID=A0A857N936_9HYME|nr:odorant receptor 28b [Sirex noctilio]